MKTWILAGLCAFGLAYNALGQETRTPPPGPPDENPFAQMDTDSDGAVTPAEFQAFHDKQFDAMDADDDGKLTSAEMKASFEKKSRRPRGRMGRDKFRDEDEEEGQDNE